VLSTGTFARRALITTAASISLVAATFVAPSVIAAPVRSDVAIPSKIDAELSGQLAKGSAELWVHFADKADLTAAAQMTDWVARGQAVYDALNRTADASQAAVREYLTGQGIAFESFFLTNEIYVQAGTPQLASTLTTFTGVSQLLPSGTFTLDEPIVEATVDSPGAVEWGLTNIKAPDVWKKFKDQGQGIVIANIDTGVQWDHPALKSHYRGTGKKGKVDHNYNWFDSTGGGAKAPFDLHGHGTHTMGTMIGDDGGANQIGVAPKAKWITANGCNTCTRKALLASAQWMLAPTKLNGKDPKPSMRPDIINNSWGSEKPNQNTFFDDIIKAWNAAGIFGQWSNGNSGPSCKTSGSPGSRPNSYSAGAYDINNNIASFSGRGPGKGSDIKPNISAPGVNVRSSYKGSAYANLSGTSMASPHVAGSIALLWSAAPKLRGDIDKTKKALDNSGIDVANDQCGGTKDDNNVFGEGRLDAYALVKAAAKAGLVPERVKH
jgi:subtilisin family serine protease